MTRPNFTLTWEREPGTAINSQHLCLKIGRSLFSSAPTYIKLSCLSNLGIIAKKFERMRSLFFNDFFVDVAIVGSLGPYSLWSFSVTERRPFYKSVFYEESFPLNTWSLDCHYEENPGYHLNNKKQIYPANRVLYLVNNRILCLDSVVLWLWYLITKRGEHHKIGSDPFQSMTAFFHLCNK